MHGENRSDLSESAYEVTVKSYEFVVSSVVIVSDLEFGVCGHFIPAYTKND